jgi:FkbM family methyltransferase
MVNDRSKKFSPQTVIIYKMTNTEYFKNILRWCIPPIFGMLRKKISPSKKYQLFPPFDNINIDSNTVDIIFDIGANIGIISQNAYKAFPHAKIYSFEPVSKTFRELEKNTLQYHDRIFPVQLGFYTGSKRMPIHIISSTGVHSSGANSLLNQSRDHKKVHASLDLKEVGEEVVELKTLDSFVQSHAIDKIDILKIDVEGVEKEVLLGGIETLKQKVQFVLIELSFLRRNRESPYWVEICQLLYDTGFELVTIYDIAKYVEDGQEYIAQMDAVFRRQKK